MSARVARLCVAFSASRTQRSLVVSLGLLLSVAARAKHPLHSVPARTFVFCLHVSAQPHRQMHAACGACGGVVPLPGCLCTCATPPHSVFSAFRLSACLFLLSDAHADSVLSRPQRFTLLRPQGLLAAALGAPIWQGAHLSRQLTRPIGFLTDERPAAPCAAGQPLLTACFASRHWGGAAPLLGCRSLPADSARAARSSPAWSHLHCLTSVWATRRSVCLHVCCACWTGTLQ